MSRPGQQPKPPNTADLAQEGQRIAAGIIATVAPLKPERRAAAIGIIAGEAVRRLVIEEPACSLPIAARAMLAREERQC